jgi:hypothetical protein
LRLFSNLLKIKLFASNIFPIALLVTGMLRIANARQNNYGCGNDVEQVFAEAKLSAAYAFLSILLVTYALELLFLPAIVVSQIIRYLRKKYHIFDRSRVDGRGGKASRFEFRLGMILKCLQCLTRGKAGGTKLKNQGELKEFATHGTHLDPFMCCFISVLSHYSLSF